MASAPPAFPLPSDLLRPFCARPAWQRRLCAQRMLRAVARLLLPLLLMGLLFLAPWPAARASSLLSLSFSHLGLADGLPSSAIVVMLQDRSGLVWLGTSNGLARFDGRHTRVFAPDPEQPGMLSHGLVNALLEDEEEDAMWVATRVGLDRIDLRSDTLRRQSLPVELSLQDRDMLGLAPAGPGQLWVAGARGLYRFDKRSGRFSAWAPPPQLQSLVEQDQQRGQAAGSLRMRVLLPDGRGGVWFAQGHRIGHVDVQGRLLQHISTLQGLSAPGLGPVEHQVRSLAFDAEGRLWVGMAGGLQTWRPGVAGAAGAGEGEPMLRPDPLAAGFKLPRSVVHALLLDRDKSMWIGAASVPALHRWREGEAGTESFINLPGVDNSLGGDAVGSLMQDRSGTLWVGSWDNGVSLADLAARGFSRYVQVPGDPASLSNSTVMSTVPDGPEHAWVGSYGGGLNHLHLPSGRNERIPASAQPLSHIKALLVQPDGRVWVGGDGGLLIYDPRRRRSERLSLGNTVTAGASISALLRDSAGFVWAASAAGLYRFDRDLRRQVFRGQPGVAGSLSHDVIDCLLEDSAGRLWIGSKGGLQLWDPVNARFEQPVRPSADQAQPGRLAIYGMRQDVQGRIWLATETGLYQLIQQGEAWQLKSWRDTPGMPRGEFSAIQDGLNGEIWLSSEQGLTQVQPARQQARFYSGLSRFGGGFGFGSAARGPDGSLYFGGPGLVRFQPEALRDNPTAPAVVLSDLLILNRSLRVSAGDAQGVPGPSPNPSAEVPSGGSAAVAGLHEIGIDGPLHRAGRIRLSHREAMVSFELAALHYNKRQQNRYAWKLEGFDRDWIQGIGNLGLAAYTNLDPGRYRLLARAANPDGVWGESQLLLEVDVLPPFWRSWWWRTAMLALLLLALFSAYRLRVRTLEQTRQRLAQLVASRTVELTEQQLQLAQEKQTAETQREAAEKARRDIGLLSEIGRQITASLEVSAIQQSLYRHVNELVDCSVFGLGLLDRQAGVLVFDFVMQRGQPFRPYVRRLDDTSQPAVECVLQARELNFGELAQDQRVLARLPGRAGGPEAGEQRVLLQDGREPEPARSGLYVPMLRQGEVIGVISVLSPRPQAFGSGELDILRTLGAYAAVALDNAEAYRRLKITQNQLVEQEKLAALGALVAGVAHELNTPIGNSLLMASTLLDNSRRFVQQVQAGSLRRSELERFCQATEESSSLLVRSLDQAANLVTGFKQIAVDQTSEQRRRFDLATLCQEVGLTLGNRLRREEHELALDVPAGLLMDSYPGPLGQVLSNLIINAVVHGLDGRRQGRLSLSARALDEQRLRLDFSDDGRGIAPENLGRIFDPFFTTRLGQGGSGLGLHICYNIVSSTLGGSISVRSEPGRGAHFEIILPRVAPQAEAPSID